MTRRRWALLVILLAATAFPAAQADPPVEVRVLGAEGSVTPEALVAAVSRADVAFIGEEYEDRQTHRVEFWLVDTISKVRGDVSLALGMLERDVQEPLDHFQMGHMDEAEFLSQARPWPGYERTYKSILDLAMSAKWPIVAPSLPRAVALEIAASGADATKARGADGAPMAREWKCPTSDAYFARFQALTGSRPSPWVTPAPDARAVERYYLAQCLKDETMAESIATAHAVASAGGKSPLVVSITDRFHSDYGQGVVERTRRRMPGRILVTIAIVPVPSLEQAVPTADDRSRADYVVLVGRSTP